MDAIYAATRAGWKARHKPKTWPRTHVVQVIDPVSDEVVSEVKVSDDPPARESDR